ncbi:MAG: CvpA family protein [Balneolaceae bacterium]|nr:CvpA family protein [Balneolaceae bacterium]
MTLIDLLILIPVLLTAYSGAVNGFVREIMGIAGLILAVFLTFSYMDPLARLIAPWFTEGASWVPFLAGAAIFLATLAVVNLIAHLFSRFLEAVQLSALNRLAGGLFGAARGAILVSVVLLLLAGFNQPTQEVRQESATYAYAVQAAPMAFDAVAAIWPGARDFADTVQRTLEQYDPVERFPGLDR